MSDTKQDTGQKIQDQPLTIREHLDPDKHWIGETLAPPTQTEIAATVGNVSGPGDSPFVARADHLHKIDPGLLPKHYNAIGTAVSGTFVGETAVCILSIPAQPVAGFIYIWSNLRLDKSLAADAFVVRQRITDTSGGTGAEAYLVGLSTGSMSYLSCSWVLAANLASNWVTSVFRNSGTGTASTYANGSHNRMTALWIPS